MSQADAGDQVSQSSAARRRRWRLNRADAAVVADSSPGAPDPFAPTVPPSSLTAVPPPPLAAVGGNGRTVEAPPANVDGWPPPGGLAYQPGFVGSFGTAGAAAPPGAPLAHPEPRRPGLPIDVAPGALDLGEPPLPPPLTLPPPTGERRWRRGRPWAVQGRRTRRVVRRIDTWTVLKVSLCFYCCVVLVLLVAGIVLWNVASTFNVITNVEKFIRSLFDLQTFTLRPWVILEYSALGGLVLVVLGTGINVLMTVLYNLISDVFGGVQVFVLEDQDL
jgi:hypothetical protein